MYEAQNAMYPYGAPQQQMYGGTPFTQYTPMAAPKMTQVLNQEQINKLRSNGGTFDLRVSENDILKAVCTHKDKGNFVLIENDDGTVTCPICGERFTLSTSQNIEDVETATNVILDVLQSVKSLYLNAPEETISNYFQMIPLLKKLPQLYKLAVDDFNKYYANANYMNSYANNSGFNLYNNILSPTGAGIYGQPQPMMQQPMQGGAPMYQQNPAMMMNPQGFNGMNTMYQQQPAPMGVNPMMGANPFAYGSPMMQPTVPQPVPGMQQPQQPVAQATQAQPTPQTVQQDKVMNV